MALSASRLKSAIISALATLNAKYENLADDHTLSGYTKEEYDDALWTAVCEQIITEITDNARATGTDSHGDSHNLNIE